MTSSSFRSLLLVASLTWVGCQSGEGVAPGEPSSTPTASEPLGRALVEAEERVLTPADRRQFAFQHKGGAFVAGHTTHHVSVEAGTARVTPFHHADGRKIQGAPLALQTRAMRRDDYRIPVALRGTQVDADGVLVLDRGPFVEELENSERGVEQRWRFAQEPAGTGDLTVEVAASGHPFVGSTVSGLHFATPGKLGFRYSHATWIDATGFATPLSVRWENGAISITVPEDLLAESKYPAVLDPTVSSEVAMDTPVVGPTGIASFRGAIASSGSEFLAVWRDGRNDEQADIYATRLSAAGAVINSVGIAIVDTSAIEDNPAVAFAGGAYVVAWDDGTNVHAARVSTTGAVTQLGLVGAGTHPQLASRGGDALVVFVNGGTEVRAAVYNGSTFGASFQVASGAVAAPTVAAAVGGEYLVAWSNGATNEDIVGQRVTAGGALSGTAITISAASGRQQEPAASHDGTNFVVVWTNRSSAGVDIFGARVDAAGTVLDTRVEGTVTVGGKALFTAVGNQTAPSLACNTGSCLASWSDRRNAATTGGDVFALRLDATLTAVGADLGVAAVGGEQFEPAVAAQGGAWRAVWTDQRLGAGNVVFSAAVAADGSLPDGSGSTIVTGNNRQVRPAVAASDVNILFAWSDSRGAGNDIMGLRFNNGGGKAETTARTISNAAGTQNNPAVSFNAPNYFVVWQDTRAALGEGKDIFGARMATDGTVLDPGGLPINQAAGDQATPAVASGGGVSLVAWQSGSDLFGAIVDGSGAVTVNDIAICAGTGSQQAPAIAYDPTNNVFLVVFNDNRSGDHDVFAARVTPAGVVLDPCGVPVAVAANNQTAARVTFGQGQFLVSWTDGRNDPNGDILAARVTATGSVQVLDAAGITIASGAALQSESTVAATGPLYVVAWTEDGNIMGQVVLVNGVLDQGNFVISNSTSPEGRPSISGGSLGTVAFVGYERLDENLDAVRVFRRRITFAGSTGGSCSSDAQCASGFCVDGVCCDSACGGNNRGDCQACSERRGAQVNGFCAIVPSTYRCRGRADRVCDVPERCDGVTAECPPDVGNNEGAACTKPDTTAGVCPANAPPGPHVCQ